MHYLEVVHVNVPTCSRALITSTTIRPNTVDKVESVNTCTKYSQNFSQQITTEHTLNITEYSISFLHFILTDS
jgi:hypothetical protein